MVPVQGIMHIVWQKFPEVTTDSLKIILKEGFVGEPSLYSDTIVSKWKNR